MADTESEATNTNQNEDGAERTNTQPSSDGEVLAPGTSEGSHAGNDAKGEGAAGEVKLSWWEKLLAAFS
jgi:hypothetical protein